MHFELYVNAGRSAKGVPVIRRQVSVFVPMEVNLWLIRRDHFISEPAQDVLVEEEDQLLQCSYRPLKAPEKIAKALLDIHEGNGFDFEDVSAAKLLASLLKEFPVTHYDVN